MSLPEYWAIATENLTRAEYHKVLTYLLATYSKAALWEGMCQERRKGHLEHIHALREVRYPVTYWLYIGVIKKTEHGWRLFSDDVNAYGAQIITFNQFNQLTS